MRKHAERRNRQDGQGRQHGRLEPEVSDFLVIACPPPPVTGPEPASGPGRCCGYGCRLNRPGRERDYPAGVDWGGKSRWRPLAEEPEHAGTVDRVVTVAGVELGESFLTCHFTVSLLSSSSAAIRLLGRPPASSCSTWFSFGVSMAFPASLAGRESLGAVASDAASTLSMNARVTVPVGPSWHAPTHQVDHLRQRVREHPNQAARLRARQRLGQWSKRGLAGTLGEQSLERQNLYCLVASVQPGRKFLRPGHVGVRRGVVTRRHVGKRLRHFEVETDLRRQQVAHGGPLDDSRQLQQQCRCLRWPLPSGVQSNALGEARYDEPNHAASLTSCRQRFEIPERTGFVPLGLSHPCKCEVRMDYAAVACSALNDVESVRE